MRREFTMSDLPTSKEAIKRLQEGNERFVRGELVRPNQGIDRRLEVLKGQTPFAAILGCSDSRVPLKIIFDQGFGDLFVVRVAGNVADDIVSASIEYAAEHLHVPLVVVLGHQNCGAVQAAVKGGSAHGHIPALLEALGPAIEQGRAQGGNDLVEQAIRANVRLTVDTIRDSSLIAPMVREGRTEVVGAYYSLETGKVEFL
jgi:carbonic anhydrase